MTLQEMLKRLRERQKKGKSHGIVSAYDYLQTLEGLGADHEAFQKFLELRKASDWGSILQKSKEALTYKNADTGVTGGSKDEEGNIVSFGTPKRKDVKMRKGSIMELECILTTVNKDRDNDILEPEGAELDEKMPFLWQHIPIQPIGVYTGLVHRDANQIMVGYSIIDSLLGRDAAQLIEFGALRISHGFQPKQFKWIEEEPDANGICFGGFHVEKYEVMEGSAVSIPANKDAVITAFSRQKLHHPMVKLWAGNLFDTRPTTKDTGGFDPKSFNPTINVNVNLADALGLNKSKSKKKEKEEEDDDEEEEDEDEKPEEKEGETTDAEDAEEENKAEEEDEADDTETEEEDEEEYTDESGKNVLLGDIIDGLEEIASMSDVPSEATNRINVCLGMLATIGETLDEHADDFNSALQSQDLQGMFSGMADLVSGVCDDLQRMVDEIGTIATLPNMPEAASARLNEIDQQVSSVRDELANIANSTSDMSNQGEGETNVDPINPDAVSDTMPMEAAATAEEKAVELIAEMLSGKKLHKVTAKALYELLTKQ